MKIVKYTATMGDELAYNMCQKLNNDFAVSIHKQQDTTKIIWSTHQV